MFCKNCGAELKGTSKFCTNCGAAFSATESVKTAISPALTSSQQSNGLGRVVKSVLVIGAIIGINSLFGGSNTEDKKAVVTNNKAIETFETGKSDQAISQFQQASNDAVSNEAKILTLKNLAYVYTSEGKDDLALTTFKEALNLTSENSFDRYLVSGEISKLEDDFEAAKTAYDEAYKVGPNKFQINNALALFYLDLEEGAPEYADYKKALVYAKRAYELNDIATARENLAIAHYFNENYEESIKLFLPSDVEGKPYSAYWIGLAYLQKKDVPRGKLYIQKAIDAGVEVPQEIQELLINN